jgi:hypothetical protein
MKSVWPVANSPKRATLLSFAALSHPCFEGVDMRERFLFDIDVHDRRNG